MTLFGGPSLTPSREIGLESGSLELLVEPHSIVSKIGFPVEIAIKCCYPRVYKTNNGRSYVSPLAKPFQPTKHQDLSQLSMADWSKSLQKSPESTTQLGPNIPFNATKIPGMPGMPLDKFRSRKGMMKSISPPGLLLAWLNCFVENHEWRCFTNILCINVVFCRVSYMNICGFRRILQNL